MVSVVQSENSIASRGRIHTPGVDNRGARAPDTDSMRTSARSCPPLRVHPVSAAYCRWERLPYYSCSEQKDDESNGRRFHVQITKEGSVRTTPPGPERWKIHCPTVAC
jgi:hypothetical protein